MSDAIARIESLLADAQALPDPAARDLARALAGALVDMTGEALRRVIDLGGPALARQLADDDLVGSVLVLAGLHPDAPVIRARRALEGAGKELASVGVTFEAIEGVGAAVRVRVVAQRGEVPDANRVRSMVEAIVVARAPDVESVVVEVSGQVVKPAGFVPIERLRVIG